MINENEIKLWISRLETEESSWANYEKLATLYIIRDQHTGQPQAASPQALYSSTSAPIRTANSAESDFLTAVNNAGQDYAWQVMDDLMDTLKITNERVYNSVMRKLQ